MAKSIKQQVDDLVKKIEGKVIKKVREKSFMDNLGKMAADQIKQRTRLGKGVKGESLVKLGPLSDKYKEFRRKKKGKLSNLTTPNRSNATATGQMLDGITHKPQEGKVTITIEGSRSMELSGEPKSNNKDVAAGYQESGRDRVFFKLSKSERAGIEREVETTIRNLIKEINRQSN